MDNYEQRLQSEYHHALHHYNWAIKELRAQSGHVAPDEWDRFMKVVVKPALERCRGLYEELYAFYSERRFQTNAMQTLNGSVARSPC